MAIRLFNKVNREVLLDKIKSDNTPRITLSFYKYYHIKNVHFFRDHLYLLLDSVDVLGRIYVANEGVNAQISVPQEKLEHFKNKLSEILFLEGIRLNFAIEDDGKSFFKLTIKIREKIVADGLDDSTFDVTDKGKHLNAIEFNTLTESDDVVIVDMRNHYESEVGHFEGAITPDVETFREALPLVADMLQDKKDKHIVMYCTGGIRCEKASAYMKHQGFQHVYQLDGGIIEYARQVQNLQLKNKFIGKNFVFDERLGERIGHQVIAKCHQCGKACDTHKNCANDACHLLFIQCEECAGKYNNCCSSKCDDFTRLSEIEQAALRPTMTFNGSKFGKSRYNPNRFDLE